MTKKPEVNIGDIISGKNAAVAAAQATSETGRESEELKEIDKNYPFNVILKRILTKNEK